MRKIETANIVRERRREGGAVSGERGKGEEREREAGGRREDREGRGSRRLTRGSLRSLSLQGNNDLGAEGATAVAPALAALSKLKSLELVRRCCVGHIQSRHLWRERGGTERVVFTFAIRQRGNEYRACELDLITEREAFLQLFSDIFFTAPASSTEKLAGSNRREGGLRVEAVAG